MDFEIRQDIESVCEITGLTIEELANELNVTRATVSNWLNERVSIAFLQQILACGMCSLVKRHFQISQCWKDAIYVKMKKMHI